MSDEFPHEPGTPRAGQLPAGRPMALHLLEAADDMLTELPENVLSAKEAGALLLQAATVHAILDVGAALRGARPTPKTLADLDQALRGQG